jgi:hypothetical protein
MLIVYAFEIWNTYGGVPLIHLPSVMVSSNAVWGSILRSLGRKKKKKKDGIREKKK